jgi:hypothetical protein
LFIAQIASCRPESASRSACAVSFWLEAMLGSVLASTAKDTINAASTTIMTIASGSATPRSSRRARCIEAVARSIRLWRRSMATGY